MRQKPVKLGNYTVKPPRGLELVEIRQPDESGRSQGADYLLIFKSRCGNIYVVIEITGIPEIHDINRATSERGITLGIVHHSGGVKTPIAQMARKYKVALVNCSKKKYIDLEEVLNKYFKEIYNRCRD